MNQRTIDLDAFIDLLDGQIDEGNNGTFYLDKQGIRAIVPGVSERQAIGLFGDKEGFIEKKVLRQFEKGCRLRFPCTIEGVRQWIERTGEADMPDWLTSTRPVLPSGQDADEPPLDSENEPTGPQQAAESENEEEESDEKTSDEENTDDPPGRAKPPGPQADITDEALDHYDQLRANGTDCFNAAMDTIAIERFHLDGIKPDSIRRVSDRRKKERSGQLPDN